MPDEEKFIVKLSTGKKLKARENQLVFVRHGSDSDGSDSDGSDSDGSDNDGVGRGGGGGGRKPTLSSLKAKLPVSTDKQIDAKPKRADTGSLSATKGSRPTDVVTEATEEEKREVVEAREAEADVEAKDGGSGLGSGDGSGGNGGGDGGSDGNAGDGSGHNSHSDSDSGGGSESGIGSDSSSGSDNGGDGGRGNVPASSPASWCCGDTWRVQRRVVVDSYTSAPFLTAMIVAFARL